MSPSGRILVLGSHGLLGSHVVAALRERRATRILEQSHPRFFRGEEIAAFLSTHQPTTIVNCIGYTGGDAAEHFKVNGSFPRAIGDWCQHSHALFIQISTNAVFPADDERCWLPGDPLDPKTPYEASKAFGEDPRSYVIRSSFIGASPKGDGLFDRLRHGKSYSNRRWNGVTAWTLALLIADLVVERDGSPSSAIEHVHSDRVITFEDIASGLRSRSQVEEQKKDAKLLGGGRVLPDLVEQLATYVKWLDRSERSLLSR